MKFRLRAFRLHLAASTAVLALVLGGLYAGWYQWPGWYLTGVSRVVLVMAGVDLALGPLLTLVVATEAKARRVLARDIAVIVAIQLVALVYGSVQLWNGRPLYYAYSENLLQLVQAYDLDPQEARIARDKDLELAPHWYSLPRWIWAPLPQEAAERNRIVASAVGGGYDVTAIPRYYRRWEQGLPALRAQLGPLDELRFFTEKEKAVLRARMRASGLRADQRNSIPLTGRGRPLLAVVDPPTLKILAILEAG